MNLTLLCYQCIKSFSNINDLKIVNLKNSQFNIFEKTSYDHLGDKDIILFLILENFLIL